MPHTTVSEPHSFVSEPHTTGDIPRIFDDMHQKTGDLLSKISYTLYNRENTTGTMQKSTKRQAFLKKKFIAKKKIKKHLF
jgi:hypothetical protein